MDVRQDVHRVQGHVPLVVLQDALLVLEIAVQDVQTLALVIVVMDVLERVKALATQVVLGHVNQHVQEHVKEEIHIFNSKNTDEPKWVITMAKKTMNLLYD